MQFNNNIRIYQDVFFPPKGYKIEWVELTTWSLAKDWLRLIVAMIEAGNKSFYKAPLKRPNSYISAAKGNKPYFHVFYDGKIQLEQEDAAYYQTANGKYAEYLFENYCTPVKLSSGLFHPKLILLMFKHNEQDIYKFRLFVSSRNLTWSKYIEAGVLLESQEILQKKEETIKECEKEGNYLGDPGRTLSAFLKKYYEENRKPENMPKEFFQLIKQAKFKVIDPSSGRTLDDDPKLYFGKEIELYKQMDNSYDCFKKQNQPMLNYTLRICSMNPTKDIWKKYTTQYICNFKDMYKRSKKDPKKWEPKDSCKDSWYIYINDEWKSPCALHAKHYMFWGGDKDKSTPFLIWVGSANCSKKGLEGKNEEVMVQFYSDANIDDYPGMNLCKGKCNSQFAKQDNRIFMYRQEDFVQDPILNEVEDEDPDSDVLPKTDVEISAKYITNNSQQVLQIELKNKEKCGISVWPSSYSEADVAKKIEAGSKECLEFTMDNPHFSRLLIMRKENDEKIYSILLSLTDENGNEDNSWHGKQYEDLKTELPLDDVTLDELIPEKPWFTSKDNIFEKLLKSKINLNQEEYIEFINETLMALNNYKKSLENVEENDDSESSTNLYRMFIERKEEVDSFRELLKKEGSKNETD